MASVDIVIQYYSSLQHIFQDSNLIFQKFVLVYPYEHYFLMSQSSQCIYCTHFLLSKKNIHLSCCKIMDGKLSYNPYRLFLFLLCWNRLVGNQQRNIMSTYLASLLGEWTHCIIPLFLHYFDIPYFSITMLCSQFIRWMCTKTGRCM